MLHRQKLYPGILIFVSPNSLMPQDIKLRARKDCISHQIQSPGTVGNNAVGTELKNILQNFYPIIFCTIKAWDTFKIWHFSDYYTKDSMPRGSGRRAGDKKVASNALNCWSAENLLSRSECSHFPNDLCPSARRKIVSYFLTRNIW